MTHPNFERSQRAELTAFFVKSAKIEKTEFRSRSSCFRGASRHSRSAFSKTSHCTSSGTSHRFACALRAIVICKHSKLRCFLYSFMFDMTGTRGRLPSNITIHMPQRTCKILLVQLTANKNASLFQIRVTFFARYTV